MKKTEDTAVEVDDIGTILKSSRLKQKKEIEKISNELCIRKIYLTALEEGDYETLPPIPYGIGYVRTYAKYLGLNPERAVKLYKAASVEESTREEEVDIAPEVNKSNHGHIFVGVLVLALIYGGWSLYAGKGKGEEQNVMMTEETFVQDTLEEDVAETVAENSDELLDEAAEETSEEETTANSEEESEANSAKDEAAALDNKVTVELLGESWIELKDKNKVYIQGVFHKGYKKEIDYTNNLFISAGRPENVKIYVRNIEKNLLAKRRKTNIPLDSLN